LSSISNKETHVLHPFFAVPSDAPQEIKAVAKSMERQNQQRPYLDKVIERAGMPQWNKVRLLQTGAGSKSRGQANGAVVYIPFVKEGVRQTGAVLWVSGYRYIWMEHKKRVSAICPF
jgi:hypothetical protein